MKKRVLMIGLIGVLLGTSLPGCTKKEPEAPTTQEVITVSINTSLKAPNAMSKAELMALSPAAVKEMVEAYLPNFRAIYSISENYVMNDEDWLALRDLIYNQLYGYDLQFAEEEEAPIDTSNIDWSRPDKILSDDGSYLDPNWIYYAPCREYVENLTDEKFVSYILNLMTYWRKDISAENLRNMDEEALAEVRNMVYDEFCVEWGSVQIPSLKELEEGSDDGADVVNRQIEAGLKTEYENFREKINEDMLIGMGQTDLSEEDQELMRAFLEENKDKPLTDTEAKLFYQGLTGVTEDTTYEEFLDLYLQLLKDQNWTVTDEDGSERAISSTEDAINYMFSNLTISRLLDYQSAQTSEKENSSASENAAE